MRGMLMEADRELHPVRRHSQVHLLDRSALALYNSFRYNEGYAMTKNRRSSSSVESPIRLTPAFFHILLAVVNEASHGYAIMQTVQERTGGAVKLGPGSLYWAINRLVDADLLEEVPAPSRDAEDERRRYYALTAFGRDVLKREVEILAEIVGYAESQKLIRRAKVV